MFMRERSIHINESPSTACNNLSILNSKDCKIVAVVHQSNVNLYMISMDGSIKNQRQVVIKDLSGSTSNAYGSAPVMQAKLVSIASRHLLVITTFSGVQMYDADGSALLYYFSLQDSRSGDTPLQGYAKGIAAVANNNICIGNDVGQIMLFNIPTTGNNITMTALCEGHSVGIQELAGCDDDQHADLLVSGDDDGDIQIWRFIGDKLQSKVKIPFISGTAGIRWPVNCLSIWSKGNCLVAGFGSGHVRIFDISSGRPLVEISAHARHITGMSQVTEEGQVVSVSEDSVCRVWKLEWTNAKTLKVNQSHSEVFADQLLQGVQHTDADGSSIFLTAFDTNEVFYMKKKSV